MTFSETLLSLRRSLRLSRRMASERIGYGQRTIQHWEDGDRTPKPIIQKAVLKQLAGEQETTDDTTI
jgi:DNA-binding transcriptional regulator YiaG